MSCILENGRLLHHYWRSYIMVDAVCGIQFQEPRNIRCYLTSVVTCVYFIYFWERWPTDMVYRGIWVAETNMQTISKSEFSWSTLWQSFLISIGCNSTFTDQSFRMAAGLRLLRTYPCRCTKFWAKICVRGMPRRNLCCLIKFNDDSLF